MNTPNNLDEQLSRLIIENQSEDGSIDISDQRAMKDEILELIQAYTDKAVKEARIEEFDVAFDCHDYDKLRAYRAKLLKEVK